MAFGVKVRVAGPIDAYDATHTEILRRSGDGAAHGLVLHVARATDDGFEVFEVWHAKDDYERFNRDVVLPAMEAIGVPMTGPAPDVVEFEPRVVMSLELFTHETQDA